MFFKHIEIQDFRGIESLTLDRVQQVNILTGRNNCGKTSILEAIFLLAGMSNPQLTVNIHAFRDLILSSDDGFSYLFKDFDIHTQPYIYGILDAQERDLKIKALHSSFSEDSDSSSEKRELSKDGFISNVSTTDQENIDGLTLQFTLDKKKSFSTEIRLKQRTVNFPRKYQERLHASFLNPQTMMHDIDRRIDAILVRKDLRVIVDALREIEPQLLDIRMGAKGMVYADIGMAKLVPINIMGDGMRRILAILAAISERKDGILLIDEIENGLHYRTLSTLWKAIFQIVISNNVQLFVTTHSYECIQAMTEVYQHRHMDSIKDFLGLFRIERNDQGKHLSFHYAADTLAAGIEKEFEVR